MGKCFIPAFFPHAGAFSNLLNYIFFFKRVMFLGTGDCLQKKTERMLL